MEGNRDSVYNLKDSSYVVYEVLKCTNATRQPGDPECLPDENITNWLENKYAQFRFINQKIDFNDRGEYAVRLNEVWLPTMPLQLGLFNDVGYRYRYNKFDRYDKWWSTNMTTNLFTDIKVFNSDTFTVPKNRTVLAEMYFRLEVDIIAHQRTVFSSMDFIGSLGGVSGFVMDLSQFFYGGYAAFHSAIFTAYALNKLKTSQQDSNSSVNDGNQKSKILEDIWMSLSLKLKLYLHKTWCAPLCFRCCKTKTQESYLELLDECDEEADEDFDIATIIENQKDFRQEIDHIKRNLGIEDQPVNVNPGQLGASADHTPD